MNQRHIYLERPDIVEQATRVIAVRQIGEATAVAVEENLHRVAGGGEPADRGFLTAEGGEPWLISGLAKIDGKTWLLISVSDKQDVPVVGMPVIASVNAAFRNAKRRLHTLEHITVATALRALPGLRITKTLIEDDASAAVIVGEGPNAIPAETVSMIDSEVRSAVLSEARVCFAKVSSVENARQIYGSLFRVNERYSFSGKVRLVIIEGIDVNPCSGCHNDTSDVGPYGLTRVYDSDQPSHFHLRLECTNAWTYWYPDRVSAA